MNLADVFRHLTHAFAHAGIPYMLTGSFASNLYGSGRATQDIDLVIAAAPEQMPTLLSFFPKDDYYFDLSAAVEAARRHSMFNILDMVSGWKIDLIFQKPGAYHREAFNRRVQANVEGVPVIAATAEDLIIAKLDWAKLGESSRQLEDVAGVLKLRKDQLDSAYIEKWVVELGLSSEWARARQLAIQE
jgi:hypothetical protein